MSFDQNEPVEQSGVVSSPIRANFIALGTMNAGPTPPANPLYGMLWLDNSDSDHPTLYCFLNNAWRAILQNLLDGPPSQSTVEIFLHTQSSPSATWTVTHGLENSLPIVKVYDSTAAEIIPNTVQSLSVNQLQITFGSTRTGFAVVVG